LKVSNLYIILDICCGFKVHGFATPNLGFDINVNTIVDLLPNIVTILVAMLCIDPHYITTCIKFKKG